jgi:hypothetical protein
MAGVSVLACKQFWTDKRLSLKTQYKDTAAMQQIFKVLCDIESLANSTPISVEESKQWTAIISSAVDKRDDYCKVISGETLFSALHGTCTATLRELQKVLKDSTLQVEDSRQSAAGKGTATKRQGLVDLGLDVISVKQMTTARWSSKGTTSSVPPLFLVTLPRTAKSRHPQAL